MQGGETNIRYIKRILKEANIDVDLALGMLDRINRNDFSADTVDFDEIPSVDGTGVVDVARLDAWRARARNVEAVFTRAKLPERLLASAVSRGDTYHFDRATLYRIGLHLLPFVAYGILNGGSATSYADRKKNRTFDEYVFSVYSDLFERVAPGIVGKPKGLTPAFFDPNGRSGPAFVELKMRSLLLQALRYRRVVGFSERVLYPMFQMTSVDNNDEIQDAYARYAAGPFLKPLIDRTGIEITHVLTGVQPMTAAYTHSSEGFPRRVFDRAYGERGRPLPLPGGHGQSFAVLRDVFVRLAELGKEFIQIGNVDNVGNVVDEVSLAVLALSGRPAGFDFAFRTAVDVKGGVLVRRKNGRLTCADIGAAVPMECVLASEKSGSPVLFNCATGLFRLSTLIDSLDRIVGEIPLRVTDQEKDAGKYSQAEQITWEVIGILDDPLIFAVNKDARFLAAKMLVENFLTSGIRLDALRPNSPTSTAIRSTAYRLHEGLVRKLTGVYGLKHTRSGWAPVD